MKKLIPILIFISSSTLGYISPTEYKHYTCDELKSDYSGLFRESINNMSKQLDYRFNSRRYNELGDIREELNSRIKAIEIAADKIECDINQREDK